MREARPSRTALRVAMRRAAHQLFDNPKVLDDPIALPIIGPRAAEKLRTESPDRFGKYGLGIRAFMVARSRWAEDALARSMQRGARQYVILGAGLDTFAYRNPYAESALRVFEVDFPATQEWKRRNLAEARITIPPSVTYAPLDFEHQTITGNVTDGGFSAQLVAYRNVFSPSNPAANYEGTYAVAIPGGHGTATVDASGNVTFFGTLVNGTTVSQSSAISRDGDWPFYAPIPGSDQSLWAWDQLINGTVQANSSK